MWIVLPGDSEWEVSLVTGIRLAPLPFKTAGTVRTRILISSQSDQLSMYCRSSSSHFSNGKSLFRAPRLPDAGKAGTNAESFALYAPVEQIDVSQRHGPRVQSGSYGHVVR